MRWLKHAFAIEPPGPAEPTDHERLVVDRLCRYVHKRGLTTAAQMLLESTMPLSYLTSQLMHFFAPLVSAVTDSTGYGHFATFLERRGAVEYLCRRLDELENERETNDQREKRSDDEEI